MMGYTVSCRGCGRPWETGGEPDRAEKCSNLRAGGLKDERRVSQKKDASFLFFYLNYREIWDELKNEKVQFRQLYICSYLKILKNVQFFRTKDSKAL